MASIETACKGGKEVEDLDYRQLTGQARSAEAGAL
jgi:hypothetical protein